MDRNGTNPFGAVEAWSKMWTDWAAAMASSGASPASGPNPAAVAGLLRSQLFAAWAEQWDQFLRSDEFLAWMGKSLSATVESRKQLNDVFAQMQHDLQGISRKDVDQLMLSLRHVERRVIDAVERLSERIDQVERRLENLAEGPPVPTGANAQNESPNRSHDT